MLSKEKEVIIAEKPSAARKIAYSIAYGLNSKVNEKKKGRVKYYLIPSNDKDIFVIPAVGHVFGLKQKSKSFTYPVFDIEWRPLYEIDKGANYVKEYVNVLKEVGRDAQSYVVATDYDIEGETIAYNILRFLFGTTNARRMKFSTLTQQELINAYKNAMKTIKYGLARAGETRHILDYYFGINLSRGLMLSMKSAGMFKSMSIGRVQGPALAILAEREKEIENFKPTPFWQIKAITEHFEALYEESKIMEKDKAEKIMMEIWGVKEGIVKKVDKRESYIYPPPAFNLTDLQTEAYRVFRLSPKETQDIAQQLYEKALISYPRTSSQKIPPTINVKSIIANLSKIKEYAEITKSILSQSKIKIVQGKKDDEAHPAIHPTGELNGLRDLSPKQMKVYDLIVKRFLSAFGEPAKRLSIKIQIDIKGYTFIAEGITTTYKGWLEWYSPYSNLNEKEIKELNKGDKINIKKITMEEKQTKPPPRYTESSIIKELEKRKLGTKATRAVIIENLYKRGYIEGKQIKVTDLGKRVYETMKKYMPTIISEELTRKMEEELELIEKERKKGEEVIEKAKQTLTQALKTIKVNEKEIGEELVDANKRREMKNKVIGVCPKCGGELIIRMSKNKKRFVGCSNYPKCTQTYPLPQKGRIKASGKVCKECGVPTLYLYLKSKKPIEVCINPTCPVNQQYYKSKEEK